MWSQSDTQRPVRGLVLGKFLPPHQGHQYLINFARAQVDELVVVVGTLPTEPIAGTLRWEWMCELCPGCTVLHLDAVLPQAPEEAPSVAAFWAQWRAALTALLAAQAPGAIDLVFASEAYGERLAQELGAEYRPVDPVRLARPISGTAIRQHPLEHWEMLPPPVRAHYALRIALQGPESCGKTTLAQQLASHYTTCWVPEYAQTLLVQRQGVLQAGDMQRIAQGQAAAEDALARQAQRLLICDTDLLSCVLWHEELLGEAPAELIAAASKRRSALNLVCLPDLPWQDDVHRLRPETRQAFLARCQAWLERWGRPYVLIGGQGPARFEAARQAIDDLLAHTNGF
ncbi:MAG: AAA family ATPase [Candidatus Sericytochromatia bacterium]